MWLPLLALTLLADCVIVQSMGIIVLQPGWRLLGRDRGSHGPPAHRPVDGVGVRSGELEAGARNVLTDGPHRVPRASARKAVIWMSA